jgi:phenylpyruvate tautomerase PptA (4-oxalocrotonate tautomerase family)
MPFLEIYHFHLEPERRRRLASGVTDGLAAAFSISPEIITTDVLDCGTDDYAHAGRMPAPERDRRMFVKVHAFPRPVDRLREASRRITDAVADAAGIAPANIAVYFLPRDPQEAAHAGRLVSDGEAPPPLAAAGGRG